MDYIGLCLVVITSAITVWFLYGRKSESISMYGMTWTEYHELPNSEQQRVIFEYQLDNNKNDIQFVDNLFFKLDNNKMKDVEEAKTNLKQIQKLDRKYGSVSMLIDAKYMLMRYIAENSPKKDEELDGK